CSSRPCRRSAPWGCRRASRPTCQTRRSPCASGAPPTNSPRNAPPSADGRKEGSRMGSFLSFGENSHRIAEADSVVVIGLGRFGTAVAVDEFDRAVIAITGDLKASNLTASLLLQLNGPVIWAKATDAQHGRILEQLGVHHVVYPETEMGRRVAHLVRGAAKDYPEIDGGYALVEASAPRELHGRPLGETGRGERPGGTIA